MSVQTRLRVIFLLASALLASFLLASCGGGTSTPATPPATPTPTPAASSSFAYLQENDAKVHSPVSPVSDDAAHLHSFARQSHLQASLEARIHLARPRLSSAVNIATGTVDAYVIDTSTGGITKLNSQSGQYNGIQLSPDATKVVFTANDSAGYSQIFLASVGGFNDPIQLTANDSEDHFSATFSADGSTILSSVFTPAAGTYLWAISKLPAAGGAETVIAIPSAMQPKTSAFTPDGTKLVFADTSLGHGLYIANLDGSGLTQLTNLNLNPDEQDMYPSVSPDGTKIAFVRGLFNTATDFWAYNINVAGIGGESTTNPATQLTTDGYSWGSMYVGDSIVFLSPKKNLTTTNTDDIYRMNQEGSDVEQVTKTGFENFLTWYSGS
jgi:Tol biopolymer transport system component